jgi:hypothetical protein
MSIEQNTGKPARLSLAERARQDLLLSEPELALGDLLQLEHHGDPAGPHGVVDGYQSGD